MNFVGITVETDGSQDFTELDKYLSLKYVKVVKLLEGFWAFRTFESTDEVLNNVEDMLQGQRGVCIRFDAMVSFTDNMRPEIYKAIFDM